MDIILTTLNSRYIHTAPSLLFLQANMAELQERTQVLEFFIKQEPEEVVDQLLEATPRVLLVSVYIWNVEPTRRVLTLLRSRMPELQIVLGGPEVSYAPQDQELMALADVVVCGEGEQVAPALCRDLLAGKPVKQKIIAAPDVPVDAVKLPYSLYTDEDVANRIIYVETSRGCPYKCEYCLSSLDSNVRFVDLEVLLPEVERLIERGVLLFKLLDRTFNTRIQRAVQILEFFLERWRPGMCLHMEMIPDRFPEALREMLQKFPPGALQFEIGVQSYNQEILDRIQRRQQVEKVHESVDWLCNHTGVVIHADLIIGLPGETEESFAYGFDRLVPLNPQHIQINLLKLLKGTPVVRHTETFGMVYESTAPFEVQETSVVSREQMDGLRQFSRIWTLFHNREKLPESLPFVWTGQASPYRQFNAFTAYIWQRFGRGHGINLLDQAQALNDFVADTNPGHLHDCREALRNDLLNTGLSCLPNWLR